MSSFETVTVAGIELGIRRGKSDNCLVMLHGIGSNRSSFELLAQELPTDVNLIAWNAPGYGSSVPLDKPAPLAKHYADKLHAVVTELGLEHFALLGHSLGTLIAAEYASRYPDAATLLILLSCAQGYAMAPGQPLPEKTLQRLNDLEETGAQAFAVQRAPRLIHQPERKPRLVEAAVAAMASINPDGYRQAVLMLSAGNLKVSAAEVRIKSLTIVGREDQITPVQQSRECHDALRHTDVNAIHEYIEIPDAGHLVHQEQPAMVARSILDFTKWTEESGSDSAA